MRVALLLPSLIALLIASLWAGAAHAKTHPITPLPNDKLVALAPLLRSADLALVESEPDGRMRQITVLTRVAASPKVVHDAVADLEHYGEFVHNMSTCTVTRNADGTADQKWSLDLTVTSFDGINRFRFLPDGPVEVTAIDVNNDAFARWEFLAVPDGSTVVVHYGWVDIIHSNSYVQSVLKKVPTMEHGIALSAQLLQVRSAKLRAEGISHRTPAFADGNAKAPSFRFLLERGAVSLIRSFPNGKLSEISVTDRVSAPRERVAATILAPSHYAEFVDGVDKSEESAREGSSLRYHLVSSLPLVSWDTRFAIERDPTGAIDVMGVDGDLKGARYRWDLTASADGLTTLAVLRAEQRLSASSLVLRALFNKEQIFEHGFAVALGLIQMRGVRARAEGKR